MRYVLGVDTSNYTTSVCLVEAGTGKVAAEVRQLLPVGSGERGLRQSEALFFHVQRLPALLDTLMGRVRSTDEEPIVVYIGVSSRPRPLAASYMPVFVAGASFAMSLGRVMGVPVLRASHQEGHIAAATAHEVRDKRPFLAVHLSGGTSDVVVARETAWGYAVSSVGEGADLFAGQFVDRVGVRLGLPFPSGPLLEALADTAPPDFALRFPASVQGASISFSGPCSAAIRAIEAGHDGAVVAAAVQACIVSSLVKAISNACALHPDLTDCVVVGGVAENQWIRQRLIHKLRARRNVLRIHFAPHRFSSDQAFGVATIARRHWFQLRA